MPRCSHTKTEVTLCVIRTRWTEERRVFPIPLSAPTTTYLNNTFSITNEIIKDHCPQRHAYELKRLLRHGKTSRTKM